MPLYSQNTSTVCLPRSVSYSVHLKCALFLGLISTCRHHICVIISSFRSLNLSLSFHQSASLLLAFLFHILAVSIKHHLRLVLYSFQVEMEIWIFSLPPVFVFWYVALQCILLHDWSLFSNISLKKKSNSFEDKQPNITYIARITCVYKYNKPRGRKPSKRCGGMF